MRRAIWDWMGAGVILGALLAGAAAKSAPRSVAPRYKVTGPVSRIASLKQYVSTASLNNTGLPVNDPVYYVVRGVLQKGQWRFPLSVDVAGATVVTIPLAISTTNHTELVEVGLVTAPLLQLANPTDGMSLQGSAVPERP